MDESDCDGTPALSAVQVCNPCRIVPVEVYQPSVSCEAVMQHQVPVCTAISPGENYAQTEHVSKVKRVSHSHLRKNFTRVVIGADRHDEKRLMQAIGTGQADLVKKLLDSGVDPCCVDEKRRTPLHIAAANGNVVMVRMLLNAGADPNQKDIIGNTPLHLAACSNNIPVVTALLQSGTDVNTLDRCGRSPMHLALGRLRILHHAERYTSDQLKIEVIQIINMMQIYMKTIKYRRRNNGNDDSGGSSGVVVDDDKTKVMSELDCLSKQLDQTSTVDEINSVNDLLSDLAKLQIDKLTTDGYSNTRGLAS